MSLSDREESNGKIDEPKVLRLSSSKGNDGKQGASSIVETAEAEADVDILRVRCRWNLLWRRAVVCMILVVFFTVYFMHRGCRRS